MNVDYISSRVEMILSEEIRPRWEQVRAYVLERWEQVRAWLQRQRARLRQGALFGAGVAAAFLAILLYQALFPPPAPLTTRDVDQSIASAIASVTPLPAFSAQVYREVQPALVLIQAQGKGE